jgi:membrane-bound ClpP family serine protease
MADPNRPESIPPNQIHWKSPVDEDPFFAEAEPTFPEGSWSEKTATVETVLDHGRKYQVRFEGSYWTALTMQAKPPLQTGDLVVILGREGNELIIQLASNGGDNAG